MRGVTYNDPFDYVIVGSGFGGSVSAMRLSEKGYRVLVLERGRRYQEVDFAKSTWNIPKFLWLPPARCFGILEMVPFRDILVLQGSGVGGGSLGYANVLKVPSDALFAAPAWRQLADWKTLLAPHYATAQRMLGVTTCPYTGPADRVLREIAAELGQADSFRSSEVGVFFGRPDVTVPDPYFAGAGPARAGCNFCGGCMVGCRFNAKNTLPKNYLYFAEQQGVEVRPNAEVHDIRPVPAPQADGARYELSYRNPQAWRPAPLTRVRARNVVVAAGTIGTLKLLFRCRSVTGSLPRISDRLGTAVRTNSEALLGVVARSPKTNYAEGIAVTSTFNADPATVIEPARYPLGSGLLRLLNAPLVAPGNLAQQLLRLAASLFTRPHDFLRTMVIPGWARRTTILLAMQTEDSRLNIRLGRRLLSPGRRSLVTERDPECPIPTRIPVAEEVARRFADKTDGIATTSLGDALLNMPTTAHILGGCPFGRDATEGVVGLDCQVHGYPGLYVVDGTIIPANPGINPALTITALAEYAMSRIQPKQVPITVAQRANDTLAYVNRSA